ncbi:MAG: lysophospholipid acyltransferase family protein [Solirubrobacteraceae bacterium]
MENKTAEKRENNLFTDPFGNIYFFKRIVVFLLGLLTYRRYNGFNKLKIKGTEHLKNLPKTNVLFVSNHQTYFADVIAMYHVFNSIKSGYFNSIKNPIYLLNPKLDFYYVAATETMKSGILPKLMSYAGAITIKRSWRSAGEDVSRGVDVSGIKDIQKALNSGWVVTFPQGTTKPFAPSRNGVAHMIMELNPIVIPIVIDGFRRSFDKKGLIVKKTGVCQSMIFKAPLQFNLEKESKEMILEKVMDSIEQSEKFIKVMQNTKPKDKIKENNTV